MVVVVVVVGVVDSVVGEMVLAGIVNFVVLTVDLTVSLSFSSSSSFSSSLSTLFGHLSALIQFPSLFNTKPDLQRQSGRHDLSQFLGGFFRFSHVLRHFESIAHSSKSSFDLHLKALIMSFLSILH